MNIKMSVRLPTSHITKKTWTNEDSKEIFQDASEEIIQSIDISDDSKITRRGNPKKCHFPKWVKEILINWLYIHRQYPYPTVSDRNDLLLQTGLSRKQLRIWLINARKRIIPTFPPPEKCNSKETKRDLIASFPKPILFDVTSQSSFIKFRSPIKSAEYQSVFSSLIKDPWVSAYCSCDNSNSFLWLQSCC